MPYLKFDKTELVDLQYSASKELLRTNRSGSYSSTTISGCNTRKYHGLLVSPIKALENAMHVLLSSLDISIIQHNQEFNLALHKYQGDHYEPKGHKYLKDFTVDTIPQFTYGVGGVLLSVSRILISNTEQVLIKITLNKAHSETKLRLKPMLSFRHIHELTRENMEANTRVQHLKHGIVAQLYQNYPRLYMQTSAPNEFVAMPLWYHDVEYTEEQKRGYAYKEDLLSLGYFELPIKVGEDIYFSASLQEMPPAQLQQQFEQAKAQRIPRNSFIDCMRNAAQQFIKKSEKGTELVAGFPWYGSIPRDSLLAAATLALENNDETSYLSIIDTLVENLEIDSGEIWGSQQKSADAPLWLFYSLQQYKEYIPKAPIWEKYGAVLRNIITAYKKERLAHIRYMENGLLYIEKESPSLTWMNSESNHGNPIINRYGYIVELCALWYNAVRCSIEWATEAKDFDFVEEWEASAQLITENFSKIFSNDDKDYLADYVTTEEQNFDLRPNQLLAVALPYSPIDKEMINKVRQAIASELLTPKGIRSLSPQHLNYSKSCEGSHYEREKSIHQGSVHPWLLSFYCETLLKLSSRNISNTLKDILKNFEEDMTTYGIGTIGEMYDADPPHRPRGAISMAISVASILRINRLYERQVKALSIEEKKQRI